ncbi:MAG: hypothetical protein M3R27_09100, partial [Bacteroidota bacterium]|nr:hypothetical protein [Bacteroidota bacterium]
NDIPDFLNCFNRQKPQTIQVTELLPSKTALLLFYGISNFKNFSEDSKTYSLKNASSFSAGNPDAYDPEFRNKLTEWIDNEIALVLTESTNEDLRENTYAVIKSGDLESAQASLYSLADSVNKRRKSIPDSLNLFNPAEKDTVTFQGHFISRIVLEGFLPHLLGSNFSGITENYFSSVGNYIVFGNSRTAIQNFIIDSENKKTLSKNTSYQAFSENISSEANIYLYSAINKSTEIYKTYLGLKSAGELEKKKNILQKFEAAGIQFSSGSKGFYSTVFLKYNPSFKQETGTLWECPLDTTISTKPFTLINHKTKAKEILVQDDANKIYLISNTGKLIWTKQLNEKIMSEVTQVDVLKNDKLQMVFNTRSFIYMFDRNGNDMKGFPVKLRSPATNSISVIDYENNRDYRIFIATENKRIVCYQADGVQLTAFKFDKTQHPVYLPLQYFSAANKDHLCAVDVKGKAYILNRQGESRVNIESGKDYSRTWIISSDTLGNVNRLRLDGTRENIRFQDFETTPYFDYKDINNDRIKEFIFLTRNELKVFSQDRSLLFKYEFKDTVSAGSQFFLFPDESGKIGVVTQSTGEIYLFNNNGSLQAGFPLKGKTWFTITDLNNEGAYNLITGSPDNSVYVYQLQ